MEYGILELGAEKLVARYVGSAEQLAYSESVFRDSLLSLDGQRLIAGSLPPVETRTISHHEQLYRDSLKSKVADGGDVDLFE